MNIKSITFWPNGNMLVFDENGEQMGELQLNLYTLYFEFLESIGIDPVAIPKMSFVGNKGEWVLLKPFKTERGWNFNIVKEGES